MPALSVILLNGIDIYWLFAHQNKIRNATECHQWLGNIFTVVICNATMIIGNRIWSIILELMLLFRAKEWVDFYQSTFQWITHEWDAHEVELNMFYWIVL